MINAAEIRTAAARIRGLAEYATPGPWTVEPEFRLREGCRCLSCAEDEPFGWSIPDIDGYGRDHSPIVSEGNAHWIATLGPQIAETLAAWLEDAANTQEIHEETWRYLGKQGQPHPLGFVIRAQALTDSILGGTS